MWNRHESGPSTANGQPQTPAPYPFPPVVAEGKSTRMSTPSVASTGSSLFIKGHLSAEEDLTMDGRIEGQIDLPGHTLTIGPNANVKATIAARMMTVFGTVSGTLVVHERLEVRNGATIEGDVTCGRIAIQEGAVVTGTITMPRRESQPKGAATDTPALAAAV